MGGTTAKASIVERGAIALSSEYEVGGGIHQGSRLIKGSGHLIRIPAIDVSEVGAGGGSLAWIDAGGVLRVGPESAGAVPGPACYARGGERPTVTDANVVLGYLNPGYLVGGELRLDAARAERALREHVAEPLGLPLLEAADGIHRIANAAMQRAIRSVSIERGRDPRDFTLVAFGGSGPVHAAGLAEALDITRILIPPHPGLFSAIGLLSADVEQLYTRSFLRELGKADLAAAETIFRDMEARVLGDLADRRIRRRQRAARALCGPALPQADLGAAAAAAGAAARERRPGAVGGGLPCRARDHLRLCDARRARRDRVAEGEGACGARDRRPRLEPDARGQGAGRRAHRLFRSRPRRAVGAGAGTRRPRRAPAVRAARHRRVRLDDGRAAGLERPPRRTRVRPSGACVMRRDVVIPGIDPVTFEVLRMGLDTIADEMAYTIVRSARSTMIKDCMDYSASLCTAQGRADRAGGEHPGHDVLDPGRARCRRFANSGRRSRPGDCIILSDPYEGGSHLPDIFMFAPIFWEGRLIAFSSTCAHHADVGGMVPGSGSSDATEIFQEGLRIPIVKLYEAGKPNAALYELILRNVRFPAMLEGDLEAQRAACLIGERELQRLVARYGVDTVVNGMEALLDYSERIVREEIAAMPDGVYEFTDYVDEDGMDPDPIPIRL